MSGFVDEALNRGRALAQALMESTVRIRRQTGEVRNPTTGKLQKTWDVIYEGPARLRETNAQPREIDAAGQRLAEQSPTVSLPIGDDDRIQAGASADVLVDDVGVVLTNPPAPGAVGTQFRVAGQHEQTHSTSRRLPVEVLTHGGRLPG